VAKIALPATITQIFETFHDSINLWYIGQLNDPLLINGIGLGNVVGNLVGYGVIFGLNGAMGTFVSQAVGAKQYETCGVYRNRARLIVTIVFLCLLPVYLQVEKILIFFQIDSQVSAIAGQYISYDIPALYVLGMLDIDRNFLASFDKTDLSMYC
jgi:MATE family multidrug resistance protein